MKTKAPFTKRGELVMEWRLLTLMLEVDRIRCDRARQILWVDVEDFELSCFAVVLLVVHLEQDIGLKIAHGAMPVSYRPDFELWASGNVDHTAVMAWLEVHP